jgi:hypothetical protein
MAFRRLSLVEVLHQAAMGWIRHLSTCCQVRVGSCGHIPSYKAPRPLLPKAPRSVTLIIAESPWACLAKGPRLVPCRGGRRDDQIGGEILPACAHHKVQKVRFRLVAPPQPGVVWHYLVHGV